VWDSARPNELSRAESPPSAAIHSPHVKEIEGAGQTESAPTTTIDQVGSYVATSDQIATIA
jgi:hypothetical protein